MFDSELLIFTAAVTALIYFLVKRFFHFRAWNVHSMKTNPNACWRIDRRDIGDFYSDMGQVQLMNKIEDFCLMVLRVRYRREIRVRLLDEKGESVFASRVWIARKDLTLMERLTKKVEVRRVFDGRNFIGVTAHNRFMVPAKNILDGVYEVPEKSARYTSNVIPEMIVLPASDATAAAASAAIKLRSSDDRKFVERHFRRAAWSYFLAYGTCVPIRIFFPTKHYSAKYHGLKDEVQAC